MDTMIDLRDLAWKDNDTNNIVRIIDFTQTNEVHVVWYAEVDSSEEHCMDVDAFVDKHSACGLFDDLEPA